MCVVYHIGTISLLVAPHDDLQKGSQKGSKNIGPKMGSSPTFLFYAREGSQIQESGPSRKKEKGPKPQIPGSQRFRDPFGAIIDTIRRALC
jgi:hypothetical protein